MGFYGSQHIFFSGELARLVGAGWWVLKGVGTVTLAFFSSMATAYGAHLIDQYKNKSNVKQPTQKKRKRKGSGGAAS